MADNTTLSSGSGGDTIRNKDRTTAKTPISLIDVGGTTGSEAVIGDSGVAMPVKGTGTAGSANAGVVTVQGVASMTPVQVGDNSGSLTVDAPVGTPAFVRLSDGSAAITTLPVSMAAVPTGAATAANQTTELASLSSIDGKITAVNTGAVVVSSSALPSGAATAAKQPALGTAGTASADVITVQGKSGMTAVVVDGSAVTQPVSGTVTANAGSGTLAVSLASVPSHAVTNAGTFAVQSTIAAAATNIAKAEDVASADADVGVPAMAVRKATPANTSGTDGDYEMLQMSAGRLWASATIDAALPAGTALIGDINARRETGTIYEATVALTVKRAKISAASSGENTIVAAVSTKKIRVLSMALVGVGTAVSIYFKDAASGNGVFADSTNPIPIDKSGAAGAGGLVLGHNLDGWFQTAESGALILNLSAAQAVAGCVSYAEVE